MIVVVRGSGSGGGSFGCDVGGCGSLVVMLVVVVVWL